MPDYAAIASSLTSPEGFLSRSDTPKVFGAKKQAAAAHALWSTADEQWVGRYEGIQVPGGQGTGFVLRLFWNPATTDPDVDAIAAAVQTALPVPMIRADEKAVWKGRDKKQASFFIWQGAQDRPLAQWLRERFGVSGFVSQLFDRSDLHQHVAAVAVTGGVEHLWSFSSTPTD